MKRIISILTAFIMAFVIAIFSVLTAFAQDWEDIRNVQDISPYVNGKAGGELYTEFDNSTQGLTITYAGEGTLTGWEFPLLAQGKDYDVLFEDIENNSITIRLLEGGRGEIPYINALVDFNNDTNNVIDSDTYTQAEESDTAGQNTVKEESTVGNIKAIDEKSTKKITTICPTSPVDEDTMNGTKIVIICVAAGAAVCIVILLMSKNKKLRT